MIHSFSLIQQKDKFFFLLMETHLKSTIPYITKNIALRYNDLKFNEMIDRSSPGLVKFSE